MNKLSVVRLCMVHGVVVPHFADSWCPASDPDKPCNIQTFALLPLEDY